MIGSPSPLWVSYGSTCTGPCPPPPHPPRPPRPPPAPPPPPCYCRIFVEAGEGRVVREKRDPEQSASDQMYHESNALIVSQSVLPVSAVTREKTSHPFLTGTNNGTNGSPDLWVLACSSPLCRPSSMAAVILSGAAPAPSTICDGISGRSICDSAMSRYLFSATFHTEWSQAIEAIIFDQHRLIFNRSHGLARRCARAISTHFSVLRHHLS